MNSAHWHLLLNHLPIYAAIFGSLGLLFGLILKQRILRRAAYLLFILVGLAAYPVFSTGESAEDIVEEQGVSHDIIHEHEESAENVVWGLYALGVAGIIGWFIHRPYTDDPPWFNWVVLAGSTVLIFLLFSTMSSGGKIQHKEIRGEETSEVYQVPGIC